MAGKLFIVLGDKTSHGGTVVSAQSPMTFDGKPIATVGDMTVCPLCKGSFAIVQGGDNIALMGRQLARAGDKTACGATLIPAGQSRGTHEPGGGAAAMTSSGAAAAAAAVVSAAAAMDKQAMQEQHDEQIRLVDEDGRALANVPYHITDAAGTSYKGVSDELGCCERVFTDGAQDLTVFVGVAALEKW
ncbi:PAAR domain-containing protein [Chitinolyticbacter meiyuanensis]|uniref:PAAR domain-containing protein n=1 Tax=Chitinolyticbacter meiyuanensis TaxID=682798 RepID=UPI0011E591FF|nr:PAAR domain-containing protein [Chitinolyticbacter meiyuanensis]